VYALCLKTPKAAISTHVLKCPPVFGTNRWAYKFTVYLWHEVFFLYTTFALLPKFVSRLLMEILLFSRRTRILWSALLKPETNFVYVLAAGVDAPKNHWKDWE
jgi:hypothetical protein